MPDAPPPEWAPRPFDPADQNPTPPPPPHGPPEAPRFSGCAKVLVIVGGLFFLLLLGVGGCAVWVLRSVSPVLDEANEFLADLAADDLAAALEHVSSDEQCFDQAAPYELARLNEQFDLVSYDLVGGGVSINDRGTSGEGRGTATLADGSTRQVVVSMIEEDERWKVCGIRYDDE